MKIGDVPIVGPETAEAARKALAVYNAGMVACPEPHVEHLMAKLATIYPAAKISDSEAEERLSNYTDLLQDIPADILSRAFREAAQTLKFFPSVAEIRTIAMREVNARAWRKFVLERMIARHENEWKPPLRDEDICTPAEAAAILRKAGIKGEDPEREKRRSASVAKERTRRGDGPIPPVRQPAQPADPASWTE